jgi:diadenosine tetraphosphate (Ap4A) HIT family hydrolase
MLGTLLANRNQAFSRAVVYTSLKRLGLMQQKHFVVSTEHCTEFFEHYSINMPLFILFPKRKRKGSNLQQTHE